MKFQEILYSNQANDDHLKQSHSSSRHETENSEDEKFDIFIASSSMKKIKEKNKDQFESSTNCDNMPRNNSH